MSFKKMVALSVLVMNTAYAADEKKKEDENPNQPTMAKLSPKDEPEHNTNCNEAKAVAENTSGMARVTAALATKIASGLGLLTKLKLPQSEIFNLQNLEVARRNLKAYGEAYPDIEKAAKRLCKDEGKKGPPDCSFHVKQILNTSQAFIDSIQKYREARLSNSNDLASKLLANALIDYKLYTEAASDFEDANCSTAEYGEDVRAYDKGSQEIIGVLHKEAFRDDIEILMRFTPAGRARTLLKMVPSLPTWVPGLSPAP